MSKNIRNILGLMVLVVALVACSKDPELYSPQNISDIQERPSPAALPVDPNSGDSSNSGGGVSGGSGVFNSNSGRPAPAPAVGGTNGTVSISDDDDDEDDDDSTN